MMKNEQGETDWYDGLRVFVYGTLKPGGYYWDRFCEGKVERWWPARIHGEIYDLPVGYPAAFLGGEGWIVGVILELTNRSALVGLDHLEGFDPADPESDRNEYRRMRVEAWPDSAGQPETVWAYGMSREAIRRSGGVWIESGNWEGEQ